MLGFGRRYLARGRRHARAVGLVVLSLCLAAIAVDGARLLVEQRHLQNAVDAAALAAARDLPAAGTPCASAPGCPQAVSQDAMAYSDGNGGPDVPFRPCNGPADTDCYVNPYDHNPKVIQVRITETPGTFFLGKLGLAGPVTVSSSVALGSAALGTVFPSSTVTNVSGGSDAALFASGTSCAAIDIEGATATVNGTILTNGGIKTRKSSYVFNGPLSYHPGAQTPPCSSPNGSFNSGVTTNGGGNLLPEAMGYRHPLCRHAQYVHGGDVRPGRRERGLVLFGESDRRPERSPVDHAHRAEGDRRREGISEPHGQPGRSRSPHRCHRQQ